MMKKSNILITLILIVMLLASCQNDTSVAAWVDDAPITLSEMNYWMLLNKAKVHRHFYMTYGVNDSDDFWASSYGEESPLEMLKSLALQDAKRCKVQQLLACEKGLIVELNFDSMVASMPRANQKRSEKVERGEVIYGPKQFTIRTYFSYLNDKMVFKLKEQLVKQELAPTREELEALKPSPETSVDQYKGFLSMQYVDDNYDAFIDSIMAAYVVRLNKSNWNTIVL